METLPERALAEAFALSKARGADLLVRLGDYDVWRGDLAAMRGDQPRRADAPDEDRTAEPKTRIFVDALVLARAIEMLQPVCRAALAAVYAERTDAASLAAELDTNAEGAHRIVTNCEKRLLEIYISLSRTSDDTQQTVPNWVSEREHAAAGGSRRR